MSQRKIRVHDGMVGALILAGVVLAYTVDDRWLWLAGAIALLLIISAFTGFCPVYALLNHVMPCHNNSGRQS